MGLDSMKKMLFLKQIRDENGLLVVFNKPCVFLPVRMLIELQAELEAELGKEKVRSAFYNVGKKRTARGALFFKALKGLNRAFEKLSLGSPLIQMGALSLSSTGWGDFSIVKTKKDRIFARTSNSPFAAAYIKELGVSNEPVCHVIAGMIAGAAEIWQDGKYVAREIQCAATGRGKECVFEVKRTP